MKKQEARLENWYPEKWGGSLILRGNVYGHPRLRDGEFIHTSKVVKFHKGLGIAETLNTFYTLGEPAEVREPNYN